MSLNEADTCREFVTPALQATGWTGPRLREQYYFTDGRIFGPHRRGERKRADYLLCYTPTFPLAIVEAKAAGAARKGIQQAKDYALILKVHFAYAADDSTIIEIDLIAGRLGQPALRRSRLRWRTAPARSRAFSSPDFARR